MAGKIEAKDLDELYDVAWRQMQEDRSAAKDIYDELKTHMGKDPHMYEDVGDTLAKYAELMLKQTGQVVDLIKLASKNVVDEEGPLTDDDRQAIEDAIAIEEKDEH